MCEENVIDNKYNDYSQLRQSCNSNYEFLVTHGEGHRMRQIPYGLRYFNKEMDYWMDCYCSTKEQDLVRFFECSQFYRMLPFKLKSSHSVSYTTLFLDVAERIAKELIDG